MKQFPIRWGEPRFVCDVHLARAARYLRLLGFDTVWRNDIEDDEIVGMCRMGRVGLTADRRLQARCPRRIVLMNGEAPEIQVRRLVAMFGLRRYAHPFTRSLCCNRPMVPCEKRDCYSEIPKETYRWLEGFWKCPKCGNVYWQGTHAFRMRRKIDELLGYRKNVLGNQEGKKTNVVTPRGLEPL